MSQLLHMLTLDMVLPVVVLSLLAAALTFAAISKVKAVGTYLCDDCRFNDIESCHKAERPRAMSCTAYEKTS
ncbi:MAG: hypothetical protein J0H83_14550 [Candidatus Melainabacteria bacterium]|jgi:hypothetical protein|nr:hypothetical protein [Candidatus Melainabacteria bacterium]MBX9674366.1 hypothetical protein [Candidatus Obscuribacterales bacterium]